MDIHRKSVDMDMDMDGKFHIHGKPGCSVLDSFNTTKFYKLQNVDIGYKPIEVNSSTDFRATEDSV